MSVTKEVSKFLISNEFKFLHSLNISFIFVTDLVLKEFKFKFCNL